MIKENGRKVTCPICGSDNIIRVHPFDYVKQCESKNCPYRKTDEAVKRSWKYQFSTGVHN